MRAYGGLPLVAAVVGAGLIQFTACATLQPPPETTRPVSSYLAALAQRERQLTSLQTPAIMEYAGASAHVKARELIRVQRPASLRVEALSPLGVALIITADANQIAVFDPGKNTLTRAAATAATLDRVARIPMRPERAVMLLLGLPPDPQILTQATPSASAQDRNPTFSYKRPDGAVDELSFVGGNLATIRETAADGALAFEVNYTDYRDIGGLLFPYSIDATFPPSSTSIKLRYKEPIIDRVIPGSQFVLTPGPGTKELSLSLNERPRDA